MENQKVIKKRIEWVDIAKAITIILVIVGHTVDGLSRAIIYSFHMPLFFILSAYTFKCSKNNDQFVRKTEKAFRHLIIPAIVLIFIGTCKNFVIQFPSMNNWDFIFLFLKREILRWCFSSGFYVPLISDTIEGVGMPWFLVVLFIGRTLFDYLHLKLSDKKLLVWCCTLSVLGVGVGQVQFLPLSFDIVLVVMPLFYVGLKLNFFDFLKHYVQKFIVSAITFGVCFGLLYMMFGKSLEFAVRSYPGYHCSLIVAIIGTITITEFSIIISKFKKILTPVLYLGKHTFLMFVIHSLDDIILFDYWIKSNNMYLAMLNRVLLDLFIFILVSFFIEAVKKYKAKRKLKKEVQK